ncbi:hypothetical protein EBZ80_14945 [bacterium]|nr:hypothetical protein [bacterium]
MNAKDLDKCVVLNQEICPGTVVDTVGCSDAAPGINSCLNAENANLALPPGTYLIKSTINIKYDGITLSTQGLSNDTTTCMKDSSSKKCAVILAANDFCENAMLWIGTEKTPVNRVTIDHIALDGALQTRIVNGNANCRSKGRGRNLMELGGANNTLRYSASVNAVGGTAVGWAVAKTGKSSIIHRNYIANNGNGLPDTNYWSDGLTIGKVSNSFISGNLFLDNTDVDFVIGGAINTKFNGNTIKHSKKRSFAAFMLTNWSNRRKPETAQWADFRGFDIANNVFDCNSKVDICVQIGIFPWFYDLTHWTRFRTMGGSLHNNRISTDLQGVNVGGGGTLKYPFVMFDNVIDARSTSGQIGFGDRKTRSLGKLNVYKRGAENFIKDGLDGDVTGDQDDPWHSIF